MQTLRFWVRQYLIVVGYFANQRDYVVPLVKTDHDLLVQKLQHSNETF